MYHPICKKSALKRRNSTQSSWFFLNFRYFEHSLIRTKCLVLCMFKVTDEYCNNNAFMTKELRKKIMLRSNPKNNFRRRRNHDNWCKFKRQCNRCFKISKNQSFRSRISSVNVTKTSFLHLLKKSLIENFIFCAVLKIWQKTPKNKNNISVAIWTWNRLQTVNSSGKVLNDSLMTKHSVLKK